MSISKMSDEELTAIAQKGDLSTYSTAELEAIAGTTPKAAPADPNGIVDGVPKWGRDNPNLYAGAMTALDLIPAAASFAKSTGVGIPVAGAINAAAKAGQRAISGEEQSFGASLGDFAKGATIEGAGRAVGAVAQKTLDIPAVKQKLADIGEGLYASAMKFSTAPNVLSPVERKAIVQTGLRDGYMPDEASYLRLQGNVKANTKAVDDIISQGTANGDTIRTVDIPRKGELADLIQYGNQVKGVAPGYKAEVGGQISDLLAAGKTMTPDAVNASKRQLYKELEDAYRQGTLSNPTVQSRKQLASGMKTVLEEMYPEIGALNASSKELLDLSDHLARSVGRVGNRDVVGLGDKIVMDTIASIPKGNASAPATLWGAVVATIDRPIIKAKLAQILYKANTGKNLPLSQWKKGAQYIGKAANSAPARAAMEGYMLGDPLGIRQ